MPVLVNVNARQERVILCQEGWDSPETQPTQRICAAKSLQFVNKIR